MDVGQIKPGTKTVVVPLSKRIMRRLAYSVVCIRADCHLFLLVLLFLFISSQYKAGFLCMCVCKCMCIIYFSCYFVE